MPYVSHLKIAQFENHGLSVIIHRNYTNSNYVILIDTHTCFYWSCFPLSHEWMWYSIRSLKVFVHEFRAWKYFISKFILRKGMNWRKQKGDGSVCYHRTVNIWYCFNKSDHWKVRCFFPLFCKFWHEIAVQQLRGVSAPFW